MSPAVPHFPCPTVTTIAAARKARQETAEFRRFREISRELVEVSGKLRRLRSVEDTLSAQGEKRPKRSARKSRAK